MPDGAKAEALWRLEQVIAERALHADTEQSYTAHLLSAGSEKCARKFGEEALELILASLGDDRSQIANEAADVIYHLLVLLRASEVELAHVIAVLESRSGQSGLEERASRQEK